MNIGTYNIWNHDSNYNERMDMFVSVIKEENLCVLALQEVRSSDIVEKLKSECEFKYSYWKKYHDCEEGLAILSKHPIIRTWTNWDDSTDVHNSGSMVVTIRVDGIEIGISNVHLDYKYSTNREIEIIKVVNEIDKQQNAFDLLLGDFNTYPNSSIHGYLSGRQSLDDKSTRWIDLHDVYTIKNNVKDMITIDFYNNPRWDEEAILDIPGRFDWILLRNPYPKKYPRLLDYKIIGNERINNLTPSDHYGVVCRIEFLCSGNNKIVEV